MTWRYRNAHLIAYDRRVVVLHTMVCARQVQDKFGRVNSVANYSEGGTTCGVTST